MRASVAAIVMMAAGCDQIFGIEKTHLIQPPDAPPDAVGCSGETFQGPSPVPFATNGFDPSETSDGLQLWFDQDDPQSGHEQIYFAQRATTADSFDAGTRAQFYDSSGATLAYDPTLTADGLHLLFVSTRPGASVWEVERAAIGDGFPTTPSPRASLGDAAGVAISIDGLTAYIDRGGELWAATRAKLMDDFDPAVDLGIPGHDPTISPDQLEIFYDTTADPSGNIERRVRRTLADPFGAPDSVLTGAYEPSITPDSRTLLVVLSSTPIVMQMTRNCP